MLSLLFCPFDRHAMQRVSVEYVGVLHYGFISKLRISLLGPFVGYMSVTHAASDAGPHFKMCPPPRYQQSG